MLKLEGLKLAPEEKEAALHRRAARLLRIPEEDVLSVQVLRRSIDAREELHLVYTVAAEVRQEKQVLRRCRDRRVSRFAPERYALPEVLSSPEVPPVVVGAGPGGLFAALVLARCGLRPILLERGRDTTARQRDVETFWRTGVLDPESNVQFGEGGAGAFSDGKLNTGTKDLRHRWILEELVRCGAPESILTDAKPHVGTDMLHIALQNLRQELLSLGAQVRFGHRLEGLESRDGVLTGLHVRAGEGTYRLPVRAVVLAPGHSARDTFQMLYEAGVPMEAKPFAVGVRIEHRQRDMDAAQYRQYAGHPCLPASTYKLSCHTAAGRGVFSFCVCPGVTWCDLHDCLPSFLTGAMEEALPLLERKLRGYAQPDALLTAVETRSSSPVRILRDESGQSALRGLYPCGEGAGYAGGILSAAADGMRCAEKIWEVYS